MSTDSLTRTDVSQALSHVLDVARATETYFMVWDTLSVDSSGASLPRVVVVHRATHEEHRGDSVTSVTSAEARLSGSTAVSSAEVASAFEAKSGSSPWKSLRGYVVGVLLAAVLGLACWLAYKFGLIKRIKTWLQKIFS